MALGGDGAGAPQYLHQGSDGSVGGPAWLSQGMSGHQALEAPGCGGVTQKAQADTFML